ncbi:hypothetical protein R9C00_17570 [Flammeovirgaceae bacterium SG7u.111]|nr:hypothetical protein [Flammeovirgaceae bacterium SG7u.132]WPO33513.1 hypothetical protein R9C00_17570 [Flammeovirgaceae bacterium SG7u.111]
MKKKRNKIAAIQNDILRYVYHEVSPSEAGEIASRIFSDPELEDEFYNLVSLKGDLDRLEAKGEPGQRSIDNILAYSRSLDSIIH